jgi:hypothetical protein
MKAIDIFVGVDGGNHCIGVDMAGQWELHEDAVDLCVAVQLPNKIEQRFLCRFGGQAVFETRHASFAARFALGADVHAARGVFPDKDDREAWRARQTRNTRSDAAAQGLRMCFAVDQRGGHAGA